MIKEYYIKNMVCDRCIKVIRNELLAEEVVVLEVILGKVIIDTDNEELTKLKLNKVLTENGFLLISSPENIITEEVKIELIKLLNKFPLKLEGNLSDLLSAKLNSDYSKISKIFSATEKVTIEKYFIKLKIEKVKELIQSKEFNFTEISQLLDYANMNYLSRQFKNETGMSLTEYKGLNENFRNSLDQIV
ncbi:AraC-like DNA-binding protein [Gillisia mitskevichiae]|uniref:AraC-like DNA-binding protein n=1 Tax=Gillisia mitskevichiae TaxID=270921 RepID=A0A495PXJ7_9FLAO|nr:helix-turn-helix domain-containing protein [Gillisia mitskevichiae]RKS55066.1 AraC-like DNA-binding protein [Gillisia mitskevichiae]